MQLPLNIDWQQILLHLFNQFPQVAAKMINQIFIIYGKLLGTLNSIHYMRQINIFEVQAMFTMVCLL